MAEDITPAPAAQEPTAPAPAEQNPTATNDDGGNAPLIDAGGGEKPDEGNAPLIEPSDDGKKDEAQAKPEGAPETYTDFTLPEGFTLDDTRKGDATALFKELNLSQVQAQKAIDLYCKMAKQQATEDANSLMAARKQWRADVSSRENFREQKALANKGIRLLLKTEAQKKLFFEKCQWLQDAPEIFDLFVTAGSLVSEDGMGTTTQEQPKTEAEINMSRFPNL